MQSCVKFSEYWRIAVASSMLQAKVIMMKAAGARGQDQRGRLKTAGRRCISRRGEGLSHVVGWPALASSALISLPLSQVSCKTLILNSFCHVQFFNLAGRLIVISLPWRPTPKMRRFPRSSSSSSVRAALLRDVMLIGSLLTCAQEYADSPSRSRSTLSSPIRL
jgi:hypothetical protein